METGWIRTVTVFLLWTQILCFWKLEAWDSWEGSHRWSFLGTKTLVGATSSLFHGLELRKKSLRFCQAYWWPSVLLDASRPAASNIFQGFVSSLCFRFLVCWSTLVRKPINPSSLALQVQTLPPEFYRFSTWLQTVSVGIRTTEVEIHFGSYHI